MVYGVVLGMKPPEAHRSDGDGAQDVDGRITTDNRHVLHAADTDDRRQQRVSRPITVTSCMQQTPTTDGNSDSRVTWTGEEACLGLAAVNARALSVGEAGSPCNTVWPGPRPTSVPCDILIHPDSPVTWTGEEACLRLA